ncbi:beta-ketoacyl-ACP synthase III [Amycolatopsis thermophila]|uniref:3-oxoacyl-[acyl-carrier-protein] synthase-3 n=1 Tax=Amycolatopsis thermophila TaxID=206084 RepID=A0ABU0ELA0_9PSEU|nr:beta-ketoacyl-ACP synthase III [Amycolatopsis thermophila]MDQ0376061.1 3-oxoacyl-[acyl-carrier-protein] synthase-3 [Amycolatopsis thermophila]
MTTAGLVGLGLSLPPDIVSNERLIRENGLDSSDDWIRTRTGISARRMADECTSTGDLGAAAGAAALASARFATGGDVRPDMVILATTTPDHRCPSTAPHIAQRLGLKDVAAVDVSAACSGFVYALSLAHALVVAGAYRHVLVIAAETYTTTLIDPHDRDTAILFGDGAGAAVVAPTVHGEPGALESVRLGSDGTGLKVLHVPVGGSRSPFRMGQGPAEELYVRMNGRALYTNAVRRMTATARDALAGAGWSVDDVDVFIGHQANQRILDSVAEHLGLPPDRQQGNLRDLGNTAAASIPLAIADAAVRGAARPGDRTLLAAFGAGYTWGSATLRFPAAMPYSLAPHSAGAPIPAAPARRATTLA